jgi:hypothetical protein
MQIGGKVIAESAVGIEDGSVTAIVKVSDD